MTPFKEDRKQEDDPGDQCTYNTNSQSVRTESQMDLMCSGGSFDHGKSVRSGFDDSVFSIDSCTPAAFIRDTQINITFFR